MGEGTADVEGGSSWLCPGTCSAETDEADAVKKGCWMNAFWVKCLLPLPAGRVNGRLYGWPRRNILWLFMTIAVVFCCASKSRIIFVKSSPKRYFVTGFVDLHNERQQFNIQIRFHQLPTQKVQLINRRYQEGHCIFLCVRYLLYIREQYSNPFDKILLCLLRFQVLGA